MADINKSIPPTVLEEGLPEASIAKEDYGAGDNTDWDYEDTTDGKTKSREEELFEKFLEYQKKYPTTKPETKVEIETFPEDCYILIALNYPRSGEGFGSDWWKNKAPGFFFGLMPFVFQIILLSVSLSTAVEVFRSNDSQTFLEQIYRADTKVFVTQITALLAYASLPRSSLQDVLRGICLFPSCSTASRDNRAIGITISCVLRIIQGTMGILFILAVVFFKSENAIAIILDFTALDFVSELDEHAFQLCKSGTFGTKLRKKADEIADEEFPVYTKSRNKHVWHRSVLSFAAILFILSVTFLIVAQIRMS